MEKIILQIGQRHGRSLRTGFLQDRALLDEPPRPGFSLLLAVSGLRFLQSVLCLQQFLLISVMMLPFGMNSDRFRF